MVNYVLIMRYGTTSPPEIIARRRGALSSEIWLSRRSSVSNLTTVPQRIRPSLAAAIKVIAVITPILGGFYTWKQFAEDTWDLATITSVAFNPSKATIAVCIACSVASLLGLLTIGTRLNMSKKWLTPLVVLSIIPSLYAIYSLTVPNKQRFYILYEDDVRPFHSQSIMLASSKVSDLRISDIKKLAEIGELRNSIIVSTVPFPERTLISGGLLPGKAHNIFSLNEVTGSSYPGLRDLGFSSVVEEFARFATDASTREYQFVLLYDVGQFESLRKDLEVSFAQSGLRLTAVALGGHFPPLLTQLPHDRKTVVFFLGSWKQLELFSERATRLSPSLRVVAPSWYRHRLPMNCEEIGAGEDGMRICVVHESLDRLVRSDDDAWQRVGTLVEKLGILNAEESQTASVDRSIRSSIGRGHIKLMFD